MGELRTIGLIGVLLCLLPTLVVGGGRGEPIDEPEDILPSAPHQVELDDTREDREEMVATQMANRDVKDPRVLSAMRKVPRHMFMPQAVRNQAYQDHPVPIGEGQTISQPYIVALMTQTLDLEPTDRVLEIGTGSGYQAAVLAEVVAEVYSIEIKERLHESSSRALDEQGYGKVVTKHDDGYFGWKKYAPFDAIMITAAVNHVPPPLVDQLEDGGRLILPLGEPHGVQQLVLVTRTGETYSLEHILGVIFVPMTGKALGE